MQAASHIATALRATTIRSMRPSGWLVAAARFGAPGSFSNSGCSPVNKWQQATSRLKPE